MQAQQFFYLARDLGQLGDIVGSLEQIVEENPGSLHVPAMLATAQFDSGDEAAALHTLDLIAIDDLRRGEKESGWGAALGHLAEIAASGGTTPHATVLYELLSPFEGKLLATVIGLACLGAADRYLGMLSTTLERWDDADAHFGRALELETRIRGHALLPRTRYWQARFLRARGRREDERTAREILDGVVAEADRLGMRRVSEQARELRA